MSSEYNECTGYSIMNKQSRINEVGANIKKRVYLDVLVPWRKDTYELRIYGAYYVATAPYTSNREQGLTSLMGYIEGGNEDETTFPARSRPLILFCLLFIFILFTHAFVV